MSLIKERGIYGTRIQDITERADVGKGVFYNYFDTKEALVGNLVAEGVDVLEREYLADLAEERDLAKRIDALTRAQESFFKDHPEYALLFHQARGLLQLNGTRATGLRRAFADYLHRLSALLPSEGHSGTWSDDDLVDIAAALAGAAAGYRSFCIAVERPVNLATIGSTLVAGVPRVLEERKRIPTTRRHKTQSAAQPPTS